MNPSATTQAPTQPSAPPESLTQGTRAEPATDAAYDTYWESTEQSYAAYPTVRHRRRFILNHVRGHAKSHRNLTVFDLGCGEGTLLAVIREKLELAPHQLAGCDISVRAVETAKRKTGSDAFYAASLPETKERYDVIICSEVLEHTTNYRAMIAWIAEHLRDGGIAILSTQSGRIHASDLYTGHTQHFVFGELCAMVRGSRLKIVLARKWGWPLFSLQKRMTNYSFENIREKYLDGALTPWRHFVFDMSTAAYYVHDFLPWGPQLFIVARKDATGD